MAPTVAKYYHSPDSVTLILETEVLFQEAALRDGPKGGKQARASGYHVVRFPFCHSSWETVQPSEFLVIITTEFWLVCSWFYCQFDMRSIIVT